VEAAVRLIGGEDRRADLLADFDIGAFPGECKDLNNGLAGVDLDRWRTPCPDCPSPRNCRRWR
jgi:hypothetical protein